jgi:hypothetical protein
MRLRILIPVLLFLTAPPLPDVQPPKPNRSRTVMQADLDGDGKRERVALDVRRDPSLSVWQGDRRLWQGVKRQWRPWKVALGDVDGDGKRDIAVGLFKSTRFFPKPHSCLFIYQFNGRTVASKWLGSNLSKPFTDFLFADLDADGSDNLIALETLRDGKRCVTVYSWNGFGFTADWQEGNWEKAALQGIERGAVVVLADGRRLAIRRHVQ